MTNFLLQIFQEGLSQREADGRAKHRPHGPRGEHPQPRSQLLRGAGEGIPEDQAEVAGGAGPEGEGERGTDKADQQREQQVHGRLVSSFFFVLFFLPSLETTAFTLKSE